ncbi:hypothetical protein [Rufibacter hautae]|uniref:Uncharacterized protein n=1 Tax=Rufibacter hautae TaxID=2595005 RepID=A0A5B6TFS3_9BACT|nr:hypothetical protein [Rufibacter hautae]KAA3438135.1 hypothetical protein FOA19_12790 [Rufibacter hautae]
MYDFSRNNQKLGSRAVELAYFVAELLSIFSYDPTYEKKCFIPPAYFQQRFGFFLQTCMSYYILPNAHGAPARRGRIQRHALV